MSKMIMIVDDSASVRQVVGMTLRGAGHQVIEAVDGLDALAKSEGQRLNLVVCDVNMPRMDGIGFVRAFRQRPESRFTPVLMLTTESGGAMKEAGKAAGAKAWLVKPFKPDVLLSAVAKLA